MWLGLSQDIHQRLLASGMGLEGADTEKPSLAT